MPIDSQAPAPDGFTDSVAGGATGGRRAGDQDAQGAVDDVGQLPGRDHRVNQPFVEEVLGRLDVLRERGAVEGLVDPGSEEAEQGSGLGGGDVAEGSPRGHDASRGGMAQVDQVGQPGLPVGRGRRR